MMIGGSGSKSTIDYYGASKQPIAPMGEKRVFKRGSIQLDESAMKEKLIKHQTFTFLKQVPLFEKLSEAELAKLANEMVEKDYPKGTTIISPGQIGAGLYIIMKGQARVYTKSATGEEKEYRNLQVCDYFGEAAQLENIARGRGVISLTDAMLLILPRTKYNTLFAPAAVESKHIKRAAVQSETTSTHTDSTIPKNAIMDKSKELIATLRNALHVNPLFAEVSPKHLGDVVDTMWLKVCPEGSDIVKQGAEGNFLFVVEKGFADVVENGEKVFVKEAGHLIGELSLFYNAPLTSTVTATSDMVLWTIDRGTYRNILTAVSMAELKIRRDFVEKVTLLKPLPNSDKQKVADALEKVTYPSGTAIIKQGDIGDAVYFIITGKVKITKTVEGGTVLDLMQITDNSCFGERALVKNERRAAQCTAVGEVECYRLANTDFVALLGPLDSVFKEQEENYKTMVQKLSLEAGSLEPQPNESKMDSAHAGAFVPRKLNPDNIQQVDLEEAGLLGKGSFGTVNLVKHKRTGKTYALKAVGKAHIVRTKQEEHTMNEKKALVYLDHPFVIKLHATYQDKTFLYFLMEVCLGGELFAILRVHNILDDTAARFYAASILLVFEHMHNINFIYRDLKPENILLDSQGYVKLTDYGFAKELNNTANKTFTLCGTPDYLAPEVLTGVGHSKGVDWWCLGIMIYEMLAGQAPFFDNNQMHQYRKIKSGQYSCPSNFSANAKDIIAGLLKVKPTERLGIVAGGPQTIKEHAWFKGLSFDDLVNCKLVAPWKPNIKDDFDLSNFDEYDDDESKEYYPYYGNCDWCKDF